jgi:acylphosphatase
VVAVQSGVGGWVRNLDNGSVEAVLEGESAAVERVLAFMRRGPERAVVTGVVVEEGEFSGECTEFEVRR